MSIDWVHVDKALFPLKGYPDLCKRLQESFSYPFVREIFNLSLPGLQDYVRLSVGGDLQGRYADYAAGLVDIFAGLFSTGVRDMLELKFNVESTERFEALTGKSGLHGEEIAMALKFLVYWFFPMNKYLSGLVRPENAQVKVIAALKNTGVRTNLDMLQRGQTPEGREALASACELENEVILEWVNRADLSRLPWSSKATISNLIGAGYGSLKKLVKADRKRLAEDFYRYGESIGKNLKHGNEIENCQRIASIVPQILK